MMSDTGTKASADEPGLSELRDDLDRFRTEWKAELTAEAHNTTDNAQAAASGKDDTGPAANLAAPGDKDFDYRFDIVSESSSARAARLIAQEQLKALDGRLIVYLNVLGVA